MIGRWWRERRRQQLLSGEFPAEWESILRSHVHQASGLSAEQLKRLQDRVRIFVAEKSWEGCRGLQLTDEVRVTIAAQASLMTLQFEDSLFDHVQTILVYPNSYVGRSTRSLGGGLVVEEDEHRLGEAWWRGPVILSWADVIAGAQGSNYGRNLVVHEFAHQLDMLNGRVVDGTPPMWMRSQLERWSTVWEAAYARAVHAARHGQRLPLDPYALTNRAEFFAVVCEAFFQQPERLDQGFPELREVLTEYFRLDPSAWTVEHAA